jgi:hypothetical protein
MTPAQPPNAVEANLLNRLVETIEDVQVGLDPRVLALWYKKIEKQARDVCPTEELKRSIHVIQNPELPMKFHLKSSKRAIPYVIEAVENNAGQMPFATRLYFQKFVEIIQKELASYLASQAAHNK